MIKIFVEGTFEKFMNELDEFSKKFRSVDIDYDTYNAVVTLKRISQLSSLEKFCDEHGFTCWQSRDDPLVIYVTIKNPEPSTVPTPTPASTPVPSSEEQVKYQYEYVYTVEYPSGRSYQKTGEVTASDNKDAVNKVEKIAKDFVSGMKGTIYAGIEVWKEKEKEKEKEDEENKNDKSSKS